MCCSVCAITSHFILQHSVEAPAASVTGTMACSRINAVMEKVVETAKDNKSTIAAVAAGATVVAGATLLYKRQQALAVPKEGPWPVSTLPADAYDAVIVGAGPSGSTTAYYTAKQGAKVALLDKATFPRGE